VSASGSERAVIAAIIRTEAPNRLFVASQVAQIVTPQDFADPCFAEAYKVVHDLVVEGRAPTMTAMREKLTAALSRFTFAAGESATSAAQRTLVAISAEPVESRQNYTLHAEEIANNAALYRIAEIAERYKAICQQQAEGNATTPRRAADIIAEMQADALSLRVGNSKDTRPTALADILPAHWERMQEEYANQRDDALQWMDTGFFTINRMTRGFGPGHLVILAAQSGKGKSALALQIGKNLSLLNKKPDGRPAVGHIFSIEMMQEEIMDRLMFGAAGVRHDEFASRSLSAESWGNLRDAFETLRGLPLHLHDEESVTVDDIASYCRAERFKDKCDFVIVDYTQIVTPSRYHRAQSPVEEINAIVAGLKRTAKSLGIPVIALSQLNDDGLVKQSRKIKEDASVLIILERQQEAKDVPDANGNGLYYKANIAKCRHGSEGMFDLVYYPSQTRFVES